jgi:hypothetical protein
MNKRDQWKRVLARLVPHPDHYDETDCSRNPHKAFCSASGCMRALCVECAPVVLLKHKPVPNIINQARRTVYLWCRDHEDEGRQEVAQSQRDRREATRV